MDDAKFEVELIDELDHKIASQFAVFDELDTLTLPDEDIGHFVRSFGMHVTNEDVAAIIKTCRHPALNEKIHLSMILPYLRDCFFQYKFYPPSFDEIYSALKILDPKDIGTVETKIFVDIFSKEGNPFKDEEMKEFMVRAYDNCRKQINYEQLCFALVCNLPEADDCYKLAEKVQAEVEANRPPSPPKLNLALLKQVQEDTEEKAEDEA